MQNQDNNKNGQADQIKKGSELDRVYQGVKNHPGLGISALGKALKWSYGPGRALKQLVKMGLLTFDKKTKTFTTK
jgi:hypothetical protein